MTLWQHFVKVEFQTVFLVCMIQYTSCTVTLTTKNSFDGSETFIKCTSITFECKNQPYSGVHSWKYDSREVAGCTVGTCKALTDDSGYTFEYDTTNGIFRWTIKRAKGEYKDKLFECFDGTNTEGVTAKFENSGGVSFIYVIVMTVAEGISIIVILGTAWYQLKKVNASAATPGEITLFKVIWSFLLPLVIVIAGVLLTVILILITRFVNDSIIEYYDGLCCWEILLILLGIYIAIPVVLMEIMMVVVYRQAKKIKQATGGTLTLSLDRKPEE